MPPDTGRAAPSQKEPSHRNSALAGPETHEEKVETTAAYVALETLIVRREGAVLFVEISAPPMNLLGPELVRDLVTLIQKAEADESVRVLVFESANPDYFISHVDVTKISEYRAEAAELVGEPSLAMLFRYLSLESECICNFFSKQSDPWRKMLLLHFSTWPEILGDTRSDSHAWAAHPIYDLLTPVAGIEPATPGFTSVRIAPYLGTLQSLKASYPHHEGPIKVEYHHDGLYLDVVVTWPEKLTGTFVFNGKVGHIQPGENRLRAE